MIEKTTKSGSPVGIALVGALVDALARLSRHQVKRRFVSKNLDYRQVSTPPGTFDVNNT